MVTHSVSDMLIRIKNAHMAGHQTITLPFSRLRFHIADILKKNGYIADFKKANIKNKKFLRLYLKYPGVTGLRIVSKPGKRIYSKAKDLKRVKGGYGMSVVSTSEGLLTNKQAKRKNIGGEVLFEIW